MGGRKKPSPLALGGGSVLAAPPPHLRAPNPVGQAVTQPCPPASLLFLTLNGMLLGSYEQGDPASLVILALSMRSRRASFQTASACNGENHRKVSSRP
jgi:hypothetical protein